MSETTSRPDAELETAVTVERRGHVLLMGLNRPVKRNAFNLAMLDQLAAAYYELETDDDLRCGVLFAHGEHFTGGRDFAEVGPRASARVGSTSPAPAAATRGARTASGRRRWSWRSRAG